MGCRSFLTPYVDPETGKPKYYGRFNQGVVTINLVDVALSSGGNFEKFWKIFEERLALCHQALQRPPSAPAGHPQRCRPDPVAVRRTGPPEEGRERSTSCSLAAIPPSALGYAGLYECVKYMTGKSHTDAGAKPFALSGDAADERQVHGVEEGREHGLLPLRHPAGIHHLQVCQVPAEAVRHRARHHR